MHKSILITSKQVTVYKDNENSKNVNNDLANIVNLDNIMFTKLSKKKSLIESVNGTEIYISIKINKINGH